MVSGFLGLNPILGKPYSNMKVTETNNDRMAIIAIISIAITIATIVQHFSPFYVPYWLRLTIGITNSLSYILLIWYVISILKFTGQDQAILAPFYALLGVKILGDLTAVFSPVMGSVFGIINAIIIIYAFVVSLMIKARYIALPVKVFTSVLFGILALRDIAGLVVSAQSGYWNYQFIRAFYLALDLLPPLSLLFIVVRTYLLLKNPPVESEELDFFNPVDAE